MDFDSYPQQVQSYLRELLRRKVLSTNSLKDRTLLNYLCTQKFDSDYIKGFAKY